MTTPEDLRSRLAEVGEPSSTQAATAIQIAEEALEEVRHVIEITHAEIVGPDDRVVLQCTDPETTVEQVMAINAELTKVFGTGRSIIVVGNAMAVLVQRMERGHDRPVPFSLHERGEEIGRHG